MAKIIKFKDKDGYVNPYPGFPINTVIVTSTNVNPSLEYGGTWELIDKEFKSKNDSSNDYFIANSSSATTKNVYCSRGGHSLFIRLNYTNIVNLGDSTVNLGTFDYSLLGISAIPFGLYYLLSTTDNGNGVGLNYLDDATGSLGHYDTINADKNIPANSSVYIILNLTIPYTDMIDSFCDKFYWKRTA